MRVKYAGVANNAVRAAFQNAGFRRTNKPHWNVLWSKALKPSAYSTLTKFQRVSMFCHIHPICDQVLTQAIRLAGWPKHVLSLHFAYALHTLPTQLSSIVLGFWKNSKFQSTIACISISMSTGMSTSTILCCQSTMRCICSPLDCHNKSAARLYAKRLLWPCYALRSLM